MPVREREISPIKENPQWFDALEEAIKTLFKKEIYFPILKEIALKPTTLQNSLDDLVRAIQTGRVRHVRGVFTGKYSAQISKDLKEMGATWDRKLKVWRLNQSEMPQDLKFAIRISEERFERKLKKLDVTIEALVPEKIADKLKTENIFDRSIFKIDTAIKKSLKNITVVPELTREQRKKLASEYTENMKTYIKEWAEKEIVALRKDVQKAVFSGDRYETMVKTIQKSYGSSVSKAKFLARQETGLLMAKFKETRYLDAGAKKYKWGCVAGSADHPVRPMHKALEGKIFSWQNPPIVNDKGEKKNPGEDYNCRCFAKPIVSF